MRKGTIVAGVVALAALGLAGYSTDASTATYNLGQDADKPPTIIPDVEVR